MSVALRSVCRSAMTRGRFQTAQLKERNASMPHMRVSESEQLAHPRYRHQRRKETSMRPQPLSAVHNVEASSQWYHSCWGAKAPTAGQTMNGSWPTVCWCSSCITLRWKTIIGQSAIRATDPTVMASCSGLRLMTLTRRWFARPRLQQGRAATPPQPAQRQRRPEPLGMLAA